MQVIKYKITSKCTKIMTFCNNLHVLGALAQLQKTIVSFVMPVRPCMRPHGTTRLSLNGFLWNLIFEYFWNICVKEIHVSFKSGKNNGYFT